jgi:hypothetical protein
MVGGYGRGGRTIANDRNLDACREVTDLCARQHAGGYVAAFYSCRISDQFFAAMAGLGRDDAPLTYFGEIVWDKKAPGMGNPIRYQHENVALFRVGEPTTTSAPPSPSWRTTARPNCTRIKSRWASWGAWRASWAPAASSWTRLWAAARPALRAPSKAGARSSASNWTRALRNRVRAPGSGARPGGQRHGRTASAAHRKRHDELFA